jgi:hypothetical protein
MVSPRSLSAVTLRERQIITFREKKRLEKRLLNNIQSVELKESN